MRCQQCGLEQPEWTGTHSGFTSTSTGYIGSQVRISTRKRPYRNRKNSNCKWCAENRYETKGLEEGGK